MRQLELKQIYLELEREIKRFGHNENSLRIDDARDDARDAVSMLKPEIDVWISLLKTHEISCYDLEKLLNSKRDEISLTRLEGSGLACAELEIVRGDVLRMIAKSIMSTYLNTLFRPRSCDDEKYNKEF